MKSKLKSSRAIAATWRILGQPTTSVIEWIEARRRAKAEKIKSNAKTMAKRGKRFHN